MTQFATTDDVGIRLGRTLTDAETAQADLLLELATALIVQTAGKDDTWAAALVPVTPALRLLAIELVTRVMLNPGGVRTESETLGAYSHSSSYEAGTAGLLLTEAEERRVRRIVFGAGTASVRVGSLVDEDLIRQHYDSLDTVDHTAELRFDVDSVEIP